LVVFSGEYGVACKERWRQELEDLSHEQSVIIDFSDVTHLDATCMTEMLIMHDLRHAKGFERATVILRQPAIRRLFDAFKMHDVLRIVDSLADAPGGRRPAPVVHHAFCGTNGTGAARATPYLSPASKC
jgi:anti-anti-sigma regulatory factor